MTDIVAPPDVPTVPPYPALGSANFNQEAYTYGSTMPSVVDGIVAIGENAFDNATAAQERATEAGESASTAIEQAGLAGQARSAAQEAASAAGEQAGIAGTAAGTATTQAGIATTAAGTATVQAGLADTARQQAQAARGGAETARTGAEAARDQAQIFATQQLVGHSTTSLTPGAGAKTFTIETGRAFVPGMYLVATSTSTPSARMAGYVSSYDTATGQLVINVDAFGGSGARADWAIGVAVAGQVGGLTTQRITANTVATANIRYIIGAAGIKLTLPAVMAPNDRIAISEEIGLGALWQLDFNGFKLRGRALGLVDVPANYSSADWTYFDSTGGLQ